MPETLQIQRQAALLRDLFQLAAERARVESGSKADFIATTEAAEKQYHETRQAITRQFETDAASEEQTSRQKHQEILARFHLEQAAAEKEYQGARRTILKRFDAEQEATKKEHEDRRWEATTVFDAARDQAKKRFEIMERQVAAVLESFQPTEQDTQLLLEQYRRYVKEDQERVEDIPEPPDADPLQQLKDAIARTDSLSSALQKRLFPKLVKWDNYIWIFFPLLGALAYPGWVLLGWPNGLVAAGVGAVSLALGLYIWFLSLARTQVSRTYQPLCQALASVSTWSKRCQDRASETLKRQQAESEQRRDKEVHGADDRFAQRTAAIVERRDNDLRLAERKQARRMAEIKERCETELRQTEERHTRCITEIKERYETDSRELDEKHKLHTTSTKASFETTWNAMTNKWRGGLERIQAEVTEIVGESNRLFPDWSGPGWANWTPATQVPPVMRFGEFRVDISQIPNGIPRDDQLRSLTPAGFTLPAFIPFPTLGSLLFRAFGAGRGEAVQALQAVMLRYLTALPPGKVRFTIIDPVGLGQNFSAFMHLADYDEQLVTSRIWTEPQHIEQRLADLTDHMENVIQKYLRNEFETIEEYNVYAGEVAEPYRFLVVANFPVNFSEATMRRLISIASSGARCGVYTLISIDAQQALPHGTNLKDLEKHSLNLIWKDHRFVWRGSDFERYPLKLDAPPAPDQFTPLLHEIGARAKDASRVEVPFEFIAPPSEEWWTSDSSTGIDVPLGRAGATRLQHLKLGKGTSQHVLIAGRTGAGKSTLLHALITNLALHYSPEEVELYLIDFKKGVEFKTYATHELPHARVVAIESEREFGLSVLQRLDAELRYRGERFRETGSQDLNAYRQANGNLPTPRILLIVDEFQEFFVEDDKVAQEAALLLDRLVRQGRAFGIHVHLGSQTLSGAYSLARSTLGQMAVRIALQCSEADAHLILSEENSAARLLSRPGEAIYNDANGLVEGNHFFQVVWLADDRREIYLERINELARQRNLIPAQPQIVFEGNLPADVSKNALLNQLLHSDSWPPAPRSAQAWLGEAIAIKDPSSAVFRPQSGSNMLIIGQQDEAALGILSTALVSLAAQYPLVSSENQPPPVRFFIFDGAPVDSPRAGFLDRLVDVVPHPARAVSWRDLPAVIDELATEVERRQTDAGSESQAVYLIIYDLQRFRDLRKAEDDFGFSRSGEEQKANPAKQFAAILRDGPVVGVHTLVWCDTLNNVNRSLDRQAMREFEMRVLFQMSSADSSNLIDSPMANKLGPYRALFFSEEQGRLEKFRPYGAPTPEWLNQVRTLLKNKTGLMKTRA